MEISNLALVKLHAGHGANGDAKLIHRIRGHTTPSAGWDGNGYQQRGGECQGSGDLACLALDCDSEVGS